MKKRLVSVTRLKKDLQQAINDCKAEKVKFPSEAEDLDGKIYAYQFVKDVLLDPEYDEVTI